MKKVFYLLLFIATVACQATRAEPIYHGKPESYWINLLARPYSRVSDSEWLKLGTNELAILLKAVEVQNIPNAEAIRTNAIIRLQASGDPAILIPLAENSPDPHVRAKALNGLIFNGNETVTTVMVAALRDKDPEVRGAAATGLGLSARQIIPEEMPALIKCLQDPNLDVRFWAALDLLQYRYHPNLPNQSQDDVDQAAYIELKKAVSNPDSDISREAINALSTNSFPYMAFSAYAHELTIEQSVLHGTQWIATLKAVDENNKPVAGANAAIGYYFPDLEFGTIQSSWQEIKGVTDSDGIFTASHKGSSPAGFSAEKVGYYTSSGAHEAVKYNDGDPEKYNPTVTLILKRKIHPIPMYFNRVDFADKKVPAYDKPVGFDLTVGDWVAPFGKGTNSYMFFTWHMDQDTNNVPATQENRHRHIWDIKMIISFPNSGDGVQEFDVAEARGSDLHSPQEAPVDGYRPKLFKIEGSSCPNDPDTNVYEGYDYLHKNYFLRVSTVLDKDGHVKSAQYGKIYGDFEQAFSTYLNPETNSRSLEFDMKHNLGRGGGYMTY